MNLEKLLAENMIRFGTRNLTEHQVRKILKESAAPTAVANADPVVQAFVTTATNWGPTFASNVKTVTNLLNKYGLKFTNATNEKAAAFIALYYTCYSGAGTFGKMKDVIKLKELIEAREANMPITNFRATMIQLNESPDAPGKVLTVGNVTATGVSGNDPGNASELADILTYLNDFNLGALASANYTAAPGKTPSFDYFSVIPYVMRTPSAGYSTKQILDGSFIEGIPGKTPGAGSLNFAEGENGAFNTAGDEFYLYASQNYIAASGVSTGTQTTDIIWTEGPETKADLPKNMFPVLSIKLDATLTPLITTAIESAKKIGQITGLRIESGASFDEPVKLDNAGFAKAVGMATNQVPADPTLDKEGVVTDPMSGGNAFLAIMRGRALQTAIGNTAGVTPTMTAKVATGGDAARYSALYFNIKMPDGSTTTTKDNLKSIGAKTNVEQLGGQFKIAKLDIQ